MGFYLDFRPILGLFPQHMALMALQGLKTRYSGVTPKTPLFRHFSDFGVFWGDTPKSGFSAPVSKYGVLP